MNKRDFLLSSSALLTSSITGMAFAADAPPPR